MCLCVLRDARELWLEQFAGASVVARSINDQWLRGATHVPETHRATKQTLSLHIIIWEWSIYILKRKNLFHFSPLRTWELQVIYVYKHK